MDSPQWWAEKLKAPLEAQAREAERLDRYYYGKTLLEFATSKYRKELGEMVKSISDNWLKIIVESVLERVEVQGFRFGEPQADDEAWNIWQYNNLDADSGLVHEQAMRNVYSYVMVWPDDDGEFPTITPELPSESFVLYEPGSRRKRVAAIKRWQEDDNEYRINVYLPDLVYKLVETKQIGAQSSYKVLEAETLDNPLGVVPIIRFVNRPKLDGTGEAEFVEGISTQDQINKLRCDMIVAAEFSAFRQRWATGLQPEIDPETGKEKEGFLATPDRVWFSPEPDTRFGEFSQTDLNNYIRAIESLIQSLASRTRTPPHYLLGGMGTFPSGESLRAAETGLVSKVRQRQLHFGESWEEVMRLAFRAIDDTDPRAKSWKAETVWKNPETRTESELVDSLVKLKAIGVPDKQLQEEYGFSPQQIDDFPMLLQQQAIITRIQGSQQPPQEPTPFVAADAQA